MSYLVEEYDASDLDGEIFLSEAPLVLLMQAIETQFEDPVEYRRKDYVQSFITKYEFCVNHIDDMDYPEEFRDELETYYREFTQFMEETLSREYGVAFPELEDLPVDEALELIHLTYRFFIKGIKKNFVRVGEWYLQENWEELVAQLPDRKDITSANMKNRIDDPDTIAILSNMNIVVQEFLTANISLEEFLNACDDGDYMEAEFVSDQYDAFQITGDFVPQYQKVALKELQHWLEARLRQRILKKYPKRREVDPVEEPDDELLDE